MLALVVAACGGPERSSPPAVEMWAVSAEPILQIGSVDGDSTALFHRVADVLRLPNGDVVVADDGSKVLSRYTSEGVFVSRVGGEGEGPGEYRGLGSLYLVPGDSLYVLDPWGRSISVLDAAGSYQRRMDPLELTADTVFSMDEWLYGPFWVHGALHPEERVSVRAALDRIGRGLRGGFRPVRRAQSGHLWVREPNSGDSASSRWTVFDAQGTAVSSIVLPPDFEPFHLLPEEVLGVWRDEQDVQYVRAYALAASGESRSLPDWVSRTPAATAVTAESGVGHTANPAPEGLRDVFRPLARAQEIHYSSALTYTSDLDALEWEGAGDIAVYPIGGDERGWVAIFAHAEWPFICGIGYGFTSPAGWPQGTATCGGA